MSHGGADGSMSEVGVGSGTGSVVSFGSGSGSVAGVGAWFGTSSGHRTRRVEDCEVSVLPDHPHCQGKPTSHNATSWSSPLASTKEHSVRVFSFQGKQ